MAPHFLFSRLQKAGHGLVRSFWARVSCQIKLSGAISAVVLPSATAFQSRLRCCGAVSHTARDAGVAEGRQFGGLRICRQENLPAERDRGGQGRVFQGFARRYLLTRLAGDRAVVLNRACGSIGRAAGSAMAAQADLSALVFLPNRISEPPIPGLKF